ncbi:hypothetical protein RA263_30185, partial [Pseudomonas syringae pv. tagetis]
MFVWVVLGGLFGLVIFVVGVLVVCLAVGGSGAGGWCWGVVVCVGVVVVARVFVFCDHGMVLVWMC